MLLKRSFCRLGEEHAKLKKEEVKAFFFLSLHGLVLFIMVSLPKNILSVLTKWLEATKKKFMSKTRNGPISPYHVLVLSQSFSL